MTYQLPEPTTVTVLNEVPYYTADQMRQAYEQGRADMQEETARIAEKYFHSTTAKTIRNLP